MIGARPPEPPRSQFRPSDIAYLLFRHKWKIIFSSLAGIAAAAGALILQKPVYISQAKLLIRYVQENRAVGPADTADSIRSPDMRGDNILNSEMELLTTLDLASEVAVSIGASNIVQDARGTATVTDAADVIQRGLNVQVPRKSNVLQLSFRHTDPNISRSVLTGLVSGYLRLHARVHRALGVVDDLARQAEVRRRDLTDTETRLRELKESLGIAGIEESKLANADQITKLRQDLLNTEAMLAEATASLGIVLTNTVAETNGATAALAIPKPEFSREVLGRYQNVLAQLETLRKRKLDLLLQYTEEHRYVASTTQLIDDAEKERLDIESKNPGIATYAPSTSPRPGQPESTSQVNDRAEQIARVAGLEARRKTLQQQVTQLLAERAKLVANEHEILDLERKRTQYDKEFQYYSHAAEEARVDATLTSGRLANISEVQTASPPARDNQTLLKLVGGLLGGGFALGLALAAALEFYADQTLRRPTQVSRNLGVPVFLSVPRLKKSGRRRGADGLLPAVRGSASGETDPKSQAESGEDAHPIVSYAEALRDRVIMHFQLRELHHRPKLIGLTSCGKDAGVTTLATRLAASLSETGEGNVLYVDANPDLGPSAQAFYRGKQVAGIASALDQGARAAAKVNDNFYMAALNDAVVPGKVGVFPKRLANLLPQMKASDYDYIIFDLPPVTQTSATARVAGLLDMTLLVVESEKTHSELAKQVTGLLKQSRADVAAVINKHRRYIPSRLDPDL